MDDERIIQYFQWQKFFCTRYLVDKIYSYHNTHAIVAPKPAQEQREQENANHPVALLFPSGIILNNNWRV